MAVSPAWEGIGRIVGSGVGLASKFELASTTKSYVFARDRVDNVVWGCPQELGDDGELINMILAGG